MLDKIRSKTNKHDIIVPCSGGKDGSFVAHQLKFKYGMNPLCVTWRPIAPTKIGKKNLENFIKTGFDHVLGVPKAKTLKKLTALSTSYLGDPFQPFIYGQYNYPVKIAVENNISVMMYGENGEVEYGGDMKYAKSPKTNMNIRERHYLSSTPVQYWKKYGLKLEDLDEYDAPPLDKIIKNKTEMQFLSYYKFWDPQENFYYCKKYTGFQTNPDRTEGTYTKFVSLDDKYDGFHYYLMFMKFGIGRATSDSAHEIRDRKISRKEGAMLVEKYDGEFPKKYYELFLRYCNITEGQFNKIVDSWRSPHVWKKENKKWVLRKKIWEEY